MSDKTEKTDEQIAAELQAQFDSEQGQQGGASATTGGSLMHELMLAQAEADAEVAMQLQEGEYGGGKPPQSFSFGSPATSGGVSQLSDNFSLQRPDPNSPPPSSECIARLTADLKEIFVSGPEMGIFVYPDEEDITHVNVLLFGPPDTPYSGGFFHFDMLFPHDYPWRPPKVQIVTTDSGMCRFNPNLYSNGKVCLSILGTWSGPGWSSVQTMRSTLISIQSLMNSAPYHNEPGFETERKPGDIQRYNEIISHETIRVAVIGMLRRPTCGDMFTEEMREQFLAHVDEYVGICEKYADSTRCRDGKSMSDPFGESRGNFKWNSMITELRELQVSLRSSESDDPISAAATSQDPSATDTKTDQASEEAAESHVDANFASSGMAEPADTTGSAEDTASASVAAPDATTLAKQLMQSLGQTGSDAPFVPAESSVEAVEIAQALALSLKSAVGQTGTELMSFVPHSSTKSISVPATSVKPKVSIAELRKMAQSSGKAVALDEPACLVCHSVPSEFIVPPACEGDTHIYCLGCAERLVLKMDRDVAGVRESFSYAMETVEAIGNKKPPDWNGMFGNEYPGASMSADNANSAEEGKTPEGETAKTEGSSKFRVRLPDPKHFMKCVLCSKISALEIAGVEQHAPTYETREDSSAGRHGRGRGGLFGFRGRFGRHRRSAQSGNSNRESAHAVLHALRRKRRRTDESDQGTASGGSCEVHDGEPFSLFCTKCFELVCFSCAGASHQGADHALEPLEGAGQFGEEFAAERLTTLKNRLGDFEKVYDRVQHKADSVQPQLEEGESAIHGAFDELREALAKREEEVILQARKEAEKKTRDLSRHREKIGATLSEIRGAVDECKALLRSRGRDHESQEQQQQPTNSTADIVTFLKDLERAEEHIRHGSTAVVPPLPSASYTMPSISRQRKMALKSITRLMQYGDVDASHMGMFPPMGFDPMYGGWDLAASDGVVGDEGSDDDDEYADMLQEAMDQGAIPPQWIPILMKQLKAGEEQNDGGSGSDGENDDIEALFFQQLEQLSEQNDGYGGEYDFDE